MIDWLDALNAFELTLLAFSKDKLFSDHGCYPNNCAAIGLAYNLEQYIVLLLHCCYQNAEQVQDIDFL